ncbi:hypothetical protein ACJX0J_036429 [Zea mays]
MNGIVKVNKYKEKLKHIMKYLMGTDNLRKYPQYIMTPNSQINIDHHDVQEEMNWASLKIYNINHTFSIIYIIIIIIGSKILLCLLFTKSEQLSELGKRKNHVLFIKENIVTQKNSKGHTRTRI